LLAGSNFGQIIRCGTRGFISFGGTGGAGGITGENAGSIFESSTAVRIAVSGGSLNAVGGVAGINEKQIVSSYARGSVLVKDAQPNAGGIVGENLGLLENSFARNRMIDRQKHDGLNFGGLVGKNDDGAKIDSSYAAGYLTIVPTHAVVGGLVGNDQSASGNIANAYWDLDMGISDPAQGAGNIEFDPGIIGLTDAQLKSSLPAGFDPKIWGQSPKINNGYPYLVANPPK
jgi:hypothetical protein